jgi:deoxyribonuclease-4
MKLKYGAHVSIANGFLGAAMQAVEEYGSNAMQIFIKSPRSRGKKEISDEEAKEFKAYARQAGLKFFISHCSYLLNFAHPPSRNKWALDMLANDIECTGKLGGDGVVLHIGKYLNIKKEAAFKNVADSIHYVLNKTKSCKTPILLETTAGQGTEIGSDFKELKEIYRAIGRNRRVKFCVDTCHIFAAGYDVSSKKAVKQTFSEWGKKLGMRNIVCIHLNDSLKECGSKVDRHANLGKGKIGKEGVVAVVNLAKKNNIPVILETPEKIRTRGDDLDLLRSWLPKNWT